MSEARVMVVDDLPGNADSLAEYLRSQGVDARPTYDPGDAVVLAHAWLPDAAVVGMPLANGAGFPLARHLRDSIGPELKLVAVSRWTAAPDRERLERAGFDRVLACSAAPDEVRRVLSEPTPRIVEDMVRASVTRLELMIELCYSMLERPPSRDDESRMRVYRSVHRLVDILHRDCPRLPAGEPRQRIGSRITVLEKAIAERLAR